jgi:hypothetical protein
VTAKVAVIGRHENTAVLKLKHLVDKVPIQWLDIKLSDLTLDITKSKK